MRKKPLPVIVGIVGSVALAVLVAMLMQLFLVGIIVLIGLAILAGAILSAV